ncbi:ABC transporter ATP-binding protein [Roseibium aggregatum]|uniref:ABC transporter ATP-binding protein n=1 Tax=Roseibium aggregatum TaxID=187304 RepID=A0A939J5J0_9HYPH|nr:ABC transporter ATP-binding protein [Roseibium aggregatum]MBN9672300.1 ABC transporter ATP-binding protein [Roseibium aggregatum]
MTTSSQETLPNGLAAAHIHVELGGKTILPDVDFKLMAGKVTVIVGPNACGKSTLLRSLARLLPLSGGKVVLDGHDIHKLPGKQLARRLGLLPQSSPAPAGLTVRSLAARGRTPHQGPFRPWSRADEEAVERALEATGLGHLADRPIDALSGGQRQRAWLSLALAQDTELLLLDEPTTYLDLPHQIEILDLVRALNVNDGRTVAMVLHDINLAARVADRIVGMKDGRIEVEGTPEEVVTEAWMKTLFGLNCVVIRDPKRGGPLVVPA